MDKVITGLEAVNRAVMAFVRWLAVLIVAVQFIIVLGRYVFGVNSIAAQESVLYMHATLFMLAGGYTLLIDGHVRVDVFYAKFSPRIRAAINIFGHLFLLMPSMLALIYWSWPSVANSWAILEGPIAVGGIKAVFLMKSLIPAFCCLIMLQSLACLARHIQELTNRSIENG